MIMVKIKFRLTYTIYTVHQTRIMHYSDFFLFLPSLQGSFELPGKGFQNSPNWQVPAGDYYIIYNNILFSNAWEWINCFDQC